jgi:cytochrome c
MTRSGLLFSVPLLAFGMAAASAARAQDVEAGKRVFNQCRACHTIEAGGRNGVGPNLHGVVGRKAASVQGFNYSPAMKQKGEEGWVWTEDHLHAYISNPKETVPGNRMAFPGLRNQQQLDNLIAYLKSQS